MSALEEGILVGDAMAKYIKKKQQIENYGETPKSIRQRDRAAVELSQAMAQWHYYFDRVGTHE